MEFGLSRCRFKSEYFSSNETNSHIFAVFKNDFCWLVVSLSCSCLLRLLQVTEESFKVLSKLGYSCDCRGLINVKGKGELKTFFVCTDMSKQQGMGLSWGRTATAKRTGHGLMYTSWEFICSWTPQVLRQSWVKYSCVPVMLLHRNDFRGSAASPWCHDEPTLSTPDPVRRWTRMVERWSVRTIDIFFYSWPCLRPVINHFCTFFVFVVNLDVVQIEKMRLVLMPNTVV